MPASEELDLSTKTGNRNALPYKSAYSQNNESATPGYYQIFLEDPVINAELTARLRTGFHLYTFEKGEKQSLILDLGGTSRWKPKSRLKTSTGWNVYI